MPLEDSQVLLGAIVLFILLLVVVNAALQVWASTNQTHHHFK